MATSTVLGLSLSLSPMALTALRITPLLSSTASLAHAYMEWLTNSAFLGPAPVGSRLSLFLLGRGAESQPARNTGGNVEDQTKIAGEEKGVDEELEKAKQIVVPQWFTNFFNAGVVSVIGLNTLTLLSATLNLALPDGLRKAKVFYQVGLAAALGHYAFVPLVGRSVRGLVGLAAGYTHRDRERGAGEKEGVGEGKSEGKAVDWVREWVRYHTIRVCSVDVLAWGCFVWGGVHAVTYT